MAKGKGKGSDFERLTCKEFSLWWSKPFEEDDIFWRTATSGGRAKTRSKTGQSTFGQYGDMQATNPEGQPLIDLCTIEFKRGYGNATVADVMDCGPIQARAKHPQPWEMWLDQVMDDHTNAGTPFWMLITKRDRRVAMIFFPWELYTELNAFGKGPMRNMSPFIRFKPNTRKKRNRILIFGTQLSEFFRVVESKDIVAVKEEFCD